MPKCAVCGEPVNVKKHHIHYYDDYGKKRYEHVECSDIDFNKE